MERSDTFFRRYLYVVIALALICFGMGVYFCAYHLWPETRRYCQFRKAVPVQVKRVTEVELVVYPGDEGPDMHEVVVEHEYDYEGRRYKGSRASVYQAGDNFGSFQQDLYERIGDFQNHGGELLCYVLPHAPQESVIDRRSRISRFLAPAVCSFAFCAGGLLLGGYALKNRDLYLPKS